MAAPQEGLARGFIRQNGKNVFLVGLGLSLMILGASRFGTDFGDGGTAVAGSILLGAGVRGLVAP